MSWFNASTETAVLNDYSPIPEGTYHAFVSEMEVKTDKNNDEYIQTVIELMGEPPFKGRKHFESIYLVSRYDNLAERGRALLKKLCEAAGITELGGPSDLVKLIGLEIDIKLSVYKNKDTGKERNIINNLRAHVETQTPAPKPTTKVDDVPW